MADVDTISSQLDALVQQGFPKDAVRRVGRVEHQPGISWYDPMGSDLITRERRVSFTMGYRLFSTCSGAPCKVSGPTVRRGEG